MLAEDPDVSLKGEDEFGQVALHHACECSDFKIIKLLLAQEIIDVNARDVAGSTPLHLCCVSGELSALRVLLKDPRVDAAS